MGVQVIIVRKETGGFSLWIHSDQNFRTEPFLNAMSSLGIHKTERVLESYGPAEFIDEYHTERGIFCIRQSFDEFSGTSIYSESDELMEVIRQLLIDAKGYRLR